MKKPVINMTKVNKASSFLIICFLTVCALQSKAQTACTQTLRQARTVFDEGRIHEIEGLISGCIKNGFNDEERTEAYRLLILSYIYLDETAKADDAMLDLLKDNPGFSINEKADPTELINLYKTFRTEPTFFWGLKVGLNTTLINVINTYSVFNENNASGQYKKKLGFEGSLIAEKKIRNRINARGEITYTGNSFDFIKEDLPSSEGVDLTNQLFIEKQTSLGVSLMAQYQIFQRKTKWNPYVGLGATGKYLMTSNLAGDTKRNDGSSADGPDEDLIKIGIRKQFNPTVDLEIGIKSKFGLNYFFSSLKFSYGLLDITDRHYDNGRLTTYYAFAANDINTHSIVLSFGILFPNYSPKKLTK